MLSSTSGVASQAMKAKPPVSRQSSLNSQELAVSPARTEMIRSMVL